MTGETAEPTTETRLEDGCAHLLFRPENFFDLFGDIGDDFLRDHEGAGSAATASCAVTGMALANSATKN